MPSQESVQGPETKAIGLDSVAALAPGLLQEGLSPNGLGLLGQTVPSSSLKLTGGLWGTVLPGNWSWQPVPTQKGPLAFALTSRASPGRSLDVISLCLLQTSVTPRETI